MPEVVHGESLPRPVASGEPHPRRHSQPWEHAGRLDPWVGTQFAAPRPAALHWPGSGALPRTARGYVLSAPLIIYCTDADLAVDCARSAARVGLAVAPKIVSDWRRAARDAEPASVLGVTLPAAVPPEELLELAELRPKRRIAVAMLGSPEPRVGLARDLGLVAVDGVHALICALRLLEAEITDAVAADRGLPHHDRATLSHLLSQSHSAPLTVAREDGNLLALRGLPRSEALLLGEARDVASAFEALGGARDSGRDEMPTVAGVERDRILDVIFGPARELSDPSSKAALEPYDVPLPVEELCASASRAAVEAGRIGFPVRVALASPDLRTWDHPDLVADGVANAAAVRDVFRQIMALAQTRRSDARLLGVTVSSAGPAQASLDVRVRPLGSGVALLELGFAGGHGEASGDRLETLLPMSLTQLERALLRLRGRSLLLPDPARDRRRTLAGLREVLTRVGAFVHDHRDSVASVRIRPLAVLLAGGFEIRQASVEVGDHFERALRTGSR